jgi:hypothetical protein
MDLNWTVIITGFLTALPPTLLAGAALWKVIKTHEVLVETKKEINGMKTELIAAEKGKSRAEGQIEGHDTEQARMDALRGTAEDRRVP